MIRRSRRVAQRILLTGTLALSALALAGLKEQPPKGVALAGTQWLIDPHRSDDPETAIRKAEVAKERGDSRQPTADRGAMGDGDPWGGGDNRGGTWGGGSSPQGRTGLPDPRGGGWGHEQGRTSSDIDPTGGRQSASISFGGSGGRNGFLQELRRNPERLAFLQQHQTLTVTADQLETPCAAGTQEPISDSYGDGQRRCGWDKRAWVVETTRGKHLHRTDRYTISKDGKTLTYVTTASGQGMPNVRITRVYTAAPAR